MIGIKSISSTGYARNAKVPSGPELQVELPAVGELFISRGIPQLFHRFELSSDRRFESSWLFIPQSSLTQMSVSSQTNQSGVHIGTSISIEDFEFIPIFNGPELSAIFAIPGSQSVEFSQKQLESIGQFLQPDEENEQSRLDIAAEFVVELYQRDAAIDAFYKKLLSLVVSRWARSAAAIYVETPESFQLRMVVGDVTRCHFFPTEFKPDMAASIQSALMNNVRVFPVDTMPDIPTFLSMVPDFLFVHEAAKSERANQLLVVVGSGEVDHQTITYLETIGHLTSQLREGQFATPTVFLDLYSRVTEHSMGLGLMESACRAGFELLSRQISVSKLTAYRLDAKGEIATSWTATGERGARPIVAEFRDGSLPDSIISKVVASPEPVHIGDVSNGVLTSGEAKRMYLENTRSLCVVPIKARRGIVGYLEICSPVAGSYLTRFEHILEVAAAYVGTLLALEEVSDQRVIPAEDSSCDGRNALRLSSVRKLVDGFLHGFSSRVAVVVGQSEMLMEASIDPTRKGGTGRSGLDKIALAANELATRITSLRSVVDLVESPPGGTIDGSAFLADLPNIFEGFGRKIKDTRNVDIPVAYSTAMKQTFRLRAEDTIDVVVPFLMSIMECAICSGSIAVQGSAKGIIPVLGIQYKRNLLGYTTMESLINRVFPSAVIESSSESEGTAQVNGCALAYRLLNDDTYHVSLMCGAPSKAVALSANPATPGKH